MNSWTVLGLDDDADERTIKRQYAKLLKVTRPDDDPEAFQRLREAYEYALNWARDRAEEEDEYDTPTSTSTSTLERVHEALVEPAPAIHSFATNSTPVVDLVNPAADAEQAARRAAQALVEQTEAENLPRQHQLAIEQDCEAQFQQGMLQRSLHDPQQDNDLLKAAVTHLRWLTPWQTVRISGDQELRLTQMLLESYDAPFALMLQEGQERAFLGALETLTQEPWLASLERRDQFQRWTMFFLHNHKSWTTALFDRICTLFGWDDRKGIFPEPEFIWRFLIERCEKYAYIEHWQRLVASGKTDSVEEKAAFMVLNPGRKVDRLRLARFCSADVWIACERLCSTITNRYPDMLERFPAADLEGWRTLQVAPMNSTVWTWFGWLLFTLFFMIPNEFMKGPVDGTKLGIMLLMYPFLMTGICRVFMRVWRPIMLAIEDADEWISDLLLPEWLHWPASQALLMRHGIPLVLCGAVTSLQGPAALMCYVLLMLAWIFLSPYRHPQIYAPIRQSVRNFWNVNRRRLVLSAIAIGAFAVFGAIQIPERHDLRIPSSPPVAVSAHPLDCTSEQAMDLMDKECQNSLMPERCAKYSREEKISQCWRIRTRLQGVLDRQTTPHP